MLYCSFHLRLKKPKYLEAKASRGAPMGNCCEFQEGLQDKTAGLIIVLQN